MKSHKLESGTVLIFDAGDEMISTLTAFASEQHIAGAHFTAIGASSDVAIGYFNVQKKDYLKNHVNEQVEVVSLIGDIALDHGEPKVHAHVVVGKRNGAAMVLQESGAKWKRRFDPESGLALIDLGS